MALIVAALDKSAHDRGTFDCGEAVLNDFLRTKAARHQARRVSRTFVLTDSLRPRAILGYYTLSNCQIGRDALTADEARALPLHPVPAVLLGRLAVDRAQQGRRYGHWLLMDALRRCSLIGAHSGVYALVVEAKDITVKRFYERLDFRAIAGHPLKLYLPLATALAAIPDA